MVSSAISTRSQFTNTYVFKCHLKVDSDDVDVTNDGKLFHARAAATGKTRSPIVLRRVTGTTTAVDELERRLCLVPTSAAHTRAFLCPCYLHGTVQSTDKACYKQPKTHSIERYKSVKQTYVTIGHCLFFLLILFSRRHYASFLTLWF